MSHRKKLSRTKKVTPAKKTNKYQSLRSAFTIVELSVIIVVIGILAALAVVGFGSWRTSVAETEIKSALSGVQAGMEDARNRTDGYPVFPAGTEFDGANDTKDIFTPNENVTVTYNKGDATYYCVDAQSIVVPSVHWFLSTSDNNEDPKQGTCEGGEGAAPFDPNLETEFALNGLSSRETAIAVNPANGDVYYSVSNSDIRKFSPATGEHSSAATPSNSTKGMVYKDNKLYVFDGPVLQAIDLESGQREDLVTLPNDGSAMFLEGSTLYVGATNAVLAYSMDTRSLKLLYATSNGVNDMTVVGSDVYYTRASNLLKVPKSGGSATTVATLPGPHPGSGGAGLVHKDGTIYTIGRAPADTTKSVYGYNMSSGVWTEVIKDMAYTHSYNYGCASPSSLASYGPRLVYISAPPSDWGGACVVPSSKVKIYFTPIP